MTETFIRMLRKRKKESESEIESESWGESPSVSVTEGCTRASLGKGGGFSTRCSFICETYIVYK